MANNHSSFTLSAPGLLRAVVTKADICQGYDPSNPPNMRDFPYSLTSVRFQLNSWHEVYFSPAFNLYYGLF
jgi:hypothetical protein